MRLLKYIVLIIILFIMIFPLLWMFRVSLSPADLATDLSGFVSGGLTLKSYLDIFSSGRMALYLFNSLFVGIVVTLGNILFCFMVGYALSRYRFIARKFWFYSVIFVLMIPAHIIIIPLYLIIYKAGLYDTYWALILPFLVNPIGIFLVKQYVDALPSSMEEAARIDGAGEFGILVRIVMPLCRPALAVLAIQSFMTNWNSFIFPFILTSSESVRTLPVGLALYQGHQAIDWPHLMAGSTLAVVPILIVFLFFQRQIVSGLTAGAIKQ
ncbi:L-arabinose transport system permease protein AraQ [Candidatus Zixiibacteriota bacterium]|nr:L-arabinose transport system permease protein AraQ [candidate division Zixibacteria bacterium]